MSSIIGNRLQFSVFGESHGELIGGTLDNLPSGFKIDFAKLDKFVSRRKSSKNIFSTKRNEKDNYEIVSGYFNDFTTGAPLTILIKNENVQSKDYDEIKNILRPSHADYVSKIKYKGFNDFYGGGHFSGRLTAVITVFGGICKQILEKNNIYICSHISSLYNIFDEDIDNLKNYFNTEKEELQFMEKVSQREIEFIKETNIKKAKDLLYKMEKSEDSVGGSIRVKVYNFPVGFGSPMFDTIEGRLAYFAFSIGGVKGIEFGNGNYASLLKGSENNDQFFYKDGQIITKTNNAGGINGGISNGMPIVFRTFVKPTPSISKTQETVYFNYNQNVLEDFIKNTKIKIKGRHDRAIVLRMPVIMEALASITLLDILLEENYALKL